MTVRDVLGNAPTRTLDSQPPTLTTNRLPFPICPKATKPTESKLKLPVHSTIGSRKVYLPPAGYHDGKDALAYAQTPAPLVSRARLLRRHADELGHIGFRNREIRGGGNLVSFDQAPL